MKINASPKCTHHSWACKCIWTYARKTDGDAPLGILSLLGDWMVPKEESMVMCHFVKSSITLVPPHGYAQRDNYSKQSILWMRHLEKENKVKIQHNETIQGEKRMQYMDTHGRKRHYMLDGYYVDK